MSDSDTQVRSLGRRLKLLSKSITNKLKPSDDIKTEYDHEGDVEDSKSSLESGFKGVLDDLIEIALVEGYDESSYVITALNDISKQLEINDLNEASKKINSILGEVMPFDYIEFFELFEKTKETATRLRNKVCWVLLGPTGAGKSTSIHFFCGSKFRRGDGGAVIVDGVDKSLKDKHITVGDAVTESKTRYIEEVGLDLTKYKDDIILDRNEPTKILWVDSPGFEDTAGPEVNVANGIGTIRALKNAQAVKVIVTFKEAHLDYRFHIIRNIANNMGKAINDLLEDLDKKHGSPIAGFLTKSEHGKESAKKIFSKAYKEQKEKESNKNEDALFMALIYKLGIKGPLNNIKIDLENAEKNKEARIKIIKSLVEDVGYIETPSETFSEFISDSALSKLKQQIEKNYDTIENILDNDKYFENPDYIKYIIDTLNNIDKLKNIIRNAGGKFIASRLADCMSIFKSKWNNKIAKGNAILNDIDIKDCKISLLKKKLKLFHETKYIMRRNVKAIKASKYYKQEKLKDVNCLNDGLHQCFDEIYKIIMDYLKNITAKIKADDSDGEITDYPEQEDVKYDPDDSKSSVENMAIGMNDNDNYGNIYNEQIILSSIQKCFLLYKQTQQYKDIYIKRKVRKLEKLVQEVIEDLNNKLDRFMDTKESQNVNGVSKLIFMFSNLSKLHNISMKMNDYVNNKMNKQENKLTVPSPIQQQTTDDLAYDDLYDGNDNKSSKINKMIKNLRLKLKKQIANSIKNICKLYSLTIMEVNMYLDDDNDDSKMNTKGGVKFYVNVNALLRSKAIKTDDEITSREKKLISFCEWMNKLYDELRKANINKDLEIWLKNTQNKWMEWLCGACSDELKKCNDLLITEGAKSWNNVEKLLIECGSLRKVDYIENNTSQEYFRTTSEFDSGRADLAKKASDLIDKLNKDDANIDYDEIVKIASQLFNAGCSTESSEMKQIYNKLKLHLNDLKSKTEAIVLSIEMPGDLIIIQDTMKELDTLQKFANFMPDIKGDANECYKILNDQVLDVLKEIKLNYDLSKCSTESSKILKGKLIKYADAKNKIDKNVLHNVLMQCDLQRLTELIDLNENKISKLQSKNESIDKVMEEKSGTLIKDIEKYGKLVKKGKRIMIHGEDDDMDEWLNTVGFKSLKVIKNKEKELKEQSKSICEKEQKEKDDNLQKIKELNKINNEVQKCVEAESNLRSLIGDKVIEYRKDNNALLKHIAELEKLLDKKQNFIFSVKLPLYEAYNALRFLSKCINIRWNLSNKIEEKKDDSTTVLSNKYVNDINGKILKYLQAYGNYLESNLNDLMSNLAVKDVSKCDLHDSTYVSVTQKTIAKLNDCLREFREISNFDRRMADMEDYDDNDKKRKQLKLVPCLFTNHDIQIGVDNYINNIIATHKHDININFTQFKNQNQDKLPLLRFICLEMSLLDRFVSIKSNEQDTYYRIATQIDGALAKFGHDNTKDIMELFENGSFTRLTEILNALKKTADADKQGAGQKTYRGAVMQLFSVLNKLMNETKTKLLIEISKDNNIDNRAILDLTKSLKDVKSLVETIYPHLSHKNEKNKVKTEEEALGTLLFSRLKQLMRAAVQSAKKKDFRQCEKRLDNIARFMDHSTQFYVYGKIDNDNENDDENENKNDSNIATEYDRIKKQIDAELNRVLQQVKDANEALRNRSAFNPYRCLRLTTLHEQLSKSQNEQFQRLWDNIYEEIITTIQNVFTEIRQRNNQIKMQAEYDLEQKDKKMMTYGEQKALLGKIEMSSASFPSEMKDMVKSMLAETKENAKGNMQYINEGFKQFLDTNSWNQIARNLNEFENNDPKFFSDSRNQLIAKIGKIYEKFHNNMKNIPKGFMDNMDKLDVYKSIGLSFTKFTYYSNNTDENGGDNSANVIVIPHIKSTLQSMYKSIEHQFTNKCTDIRTSLRGQNTSFKKLKGSFEIIIRVLTSKDNLPQKYAENMMNESRKLFRPIQKFIGVLKARKNKGLDKESNDIDPLILTLNDLKELNDMNFHSNVRTFIPFMDEKENTIEKLEKDISNIEYHVTVKDTKAMLKDFKDTISKQGLNKSIIQKSQHKRLTYLKSLSMKCKALIKSSSIAVKHLDYVSKDDFDKQLIAPCTKRMRNDVQEMQKETNKAFKAQMLDTNDLKRANANLEAFHAIKGVFEKEIGIDDPICNGIKLGGAIEDCQQTATKRVVQLKKDIIKVKQKKLDENNTDEYFKQCAENLMNLEYLNQHMHFKTSINENPAVKNEQNELHQEIEHAIKESLKVLTDTKQTKSKMMVLYNHIVATDSSFGSVFTGKHAAFKAASAEAWRKKCRELDIDALIMNLKETAKEMKQFKQLLGVDYEKLKNIFEKIINKYKELLSTNLTKVTSFEDLLNLIPSVAGDAKGIARRAVQSKTSALNSLYSAGKAGMNMAKNALSWAMGGKQVQAKSKSKNPRDCYWTKEMRNAAPQLISYILAVWTLSDASCYYEGSGAGLTQARNAQIIAIIAILCLDIDSTQKKLINNLVQVGTGEGKSVIMAVTAIVLALLDFDVYCACYSELLSKRDQEAFDDLFTKFGVQKNIQYQTFNKILEQMINDGGDVREVTKDIVLAKKSDEKVDEKEQKQQAQKRIFYNRQKILFIDEVDKFFSTDFFGQQYTPSSVIPSEEMKNLILFVWSDYLANDSNGFSITMPKIKQSKEYANLLLAFNEEWHALLEESIKDIIDAIRSFKDDSYKIQDGKDIAYKFSDKYSSKVFYGYRTLFAYLYELNNGNITDKDYVHDKLTWFLKCGSFSYSEIPNNFYSILGVTGTLKSLSPKEHEVIQKSYGIKKYIVMPSLFDKRGKLDYSQNKDMFIIKPEYYYNTLHSTIGTYLINDIQSIERPIIVFFKDEKRLNDFYNLECCKVWRENDRIQLLTPDLNPQEKKNGILTATKPNVITFATEEYGRGIDFKVHDKKLEKKGMHVELTYWPDTLAEEIQIKGRTARQGSRGSFHIILNEEAIGDQCNVNAKDIELHQKNGDLYEWLNTIRAKVFAKQYDEASEYVKELRPIHKQSEELAMSLRMKNIPVAKEKLLLFNKGANIQSAAKLSIIIDATGSMASCLSQCKIVIQKTLPQLVKFLKDNNMDTESFEIQIIAYRNYNAYADDILEFSAFTSDVSTLTTFVHGLEADYGWGDEAVEVAFGQLNRQQKKPNIVIIMADAPAQKKEDITYKRQRRGNDYWETEQGGIFKEGLDWKEELDKFMNENNGASVFSFYLTNYAQSNFEEIAKIGNGKSMHLDVNNEAKSIALLQSALSETLLLKINNGSMEYVEKFRSQHKNMPTFL